MDAGRLDPRRHGATQDGSANRIPPCIPQHMLNLSATLKHPLQGSGGVGKVSLCDQTRRLLGESFVGSSIRLAGAGYGLEPRPTVVTVPLGAASQWLEHTESCSLLGMVRYPMGSKSTTFAATKAVPIRPTWRR